ncbi:DDE superfamily endonuclease domain,Homeobox domain-like,HTH CenpB-type DNA-binding domain [Cinara cedri]|uniref:DDE superfamily endonuclease domain,Homeobox domain-like,HTH CenpB-type DNA-binding domain n=1 Tax=Cinara cedri TaxID=506608 RepID=A0A5E4N0W3_9HEMI|nr:DDE superfamily endonuclease domain,Homeobox domain-like,HTH CenpB-type DNA-binding domain [Cinara cedri]
MFRVRKDLSLAQKLEIIDNIKLQPLGCSTRCLSEILGIPKSTIARIQLQEQVSREQAHSQVTTRKRKREGKDSDVDEALTQWFTLATSRGVQVSGPILKAKSEDLARKVGNDEFKATEGWLSRWKVKHDIKFKRAHGEKASANSDGADEWKLTKLPQILAKISLEDIYNADETGLYYRATPDGSLCFKHELIAGSKKAMERITVLCCVNVSGTDKKKLLVIGKSKKPRCFQQISLQKLPVEYHSNKNAWMTSAIFIELGQNKMQPMCPNKADSTVL